MELNFKTITLVDLTKNETKEFYEDELKKAISIFKRRMNKGHECELWKMQRIIRYTEGNGTERIYN